MKKLYLLLFLALSTYACKNKFEQQEKPNQTTTTEELVMYEMSEMALLMEKMFVENEQLKKRIESGEEIGTFNTEYLKIHSAVLTDPNDRNDNFKSFSKALMANQEAIFNSEKGFEKENFNKMVQTCISCHKTTCQGPIPRIKKLIIK